MAREAALAEAHTRGPDTMDSWTLCYHDIWVPSGKRLQKAIEHGPVEIVDLPIH